MCCAQVGLTSTVTCSPVQAPSPCALDRTAAWLLNMNSASSYGETEDDRHDDALVEKVRKMCCRF